MQVFSKKSILFLSFIVFLTSFSFGQEVTITYIDSVYKKYSDYNSDVGIEMTELKKLDSLARIIHYDLGLFKINLSLAVEQVQRNPSLAENFIATLDSLFDKDPTIYNDNILVNYYINKGYVLGATGHSIREMQNYIIADSIATASNNASLQNIVIGQMAWYNATNGDYDKALEGWMKSYNDYLNQPLEDRDMTSYLAVTYNIGTIYSNMKIPDSAIYYIDKAINEGYGKYANLNDPYIHIGYAYLEKKNYLKAEEYVLLLQDLKYVKHTDGEFIYDVTACESDIFAASTYRHLHKTDLAYAHLDRVSVYVDSVEYLTAQARVNRLYILLALEENNLDSVTKYVDAYEKAVVAYSDKKSSRIEKELLIEYETGKKEIEIAELKLYAQISKTEKITLILSGVILLLIAFLIIYWFTIKRKQLLIKLELTKKEKEQTKFNLNQAISSLKENSKTINRLKEDLKTNETNSDSVERMVTILDQDYINEHQWTEVLFHFDKLNNGFTNKINHQYDALTKNDIQLLVLIQMEYSNKTIASVKNVSESAVKKAKQRLLRKMDLEHFSKLNIT